MLTETQIANRALQRVGAARIATGALWTEDSKNASEIRACYLSLRKAELRRRVWRFATRRTPLRPFDDESKVVTFGTWAVGTTYALNDIVTDSDGFVWQSTIASNLGNTPNVNPTKWSLYTGQMVAQEFDADESIAYFAGELVYVSSTLYVSKISSNTDTPPSANWMTMTTAPTLAAANFVYPIGAGPANQDATKNVFQLPANYLREAPQNPKNGAVQVVGGPVGNFTNDWLYESNFIVSANPDIIIYRFVADINNSLTFDPMFNEGLASRIAFEVCEPLTQSGTKLQAIANEYKTFMSEAGLVNAIETGPVQPEVDPYIQCRL